MGRHRLLAVSCRLLCGCRDWVKEPCRPASLRAGRIRHRCGNPPALLWLVITFLFREREFTYHTDTLLRALRDITDPTEESAARARTMLTDL